MDPFLLSLFVNRFYLPASPATATWLTSEERTFLLARMSTSNPHGDDNTPVETTPAAAPGPHASQSTLDVDSQLLPNGSSSDDSSTPAVSLRDKWLSFRSGFMRVWNTTYRNPFIWLAVFINFTTLFPVVAVSFYLPAIISSFGLSSLSGNLLSAIPYTFASVVMAINSYHSDATHERFYHVLSMNVLGFISLGITAVALDYTHSIYFQVAALSFAAAGIWAAKPPLLAWLSATIPGNMAASIATITCAGNISGIVAPIVM
jgi:hypothetical protein